MNRPSDAVAGLLQSELERLASRRDVPHVVLGVQHGDRSWRWTGAVGEASPGGASMRPETPFHIASIDKMFTAVVIMRLVEQRHIDLDTSVTDYLPATLTNNLHRIGATDYTTRVTVRNMLAHTSGLADCFEDRPKGGRSLMERLFHDGDMAWTVEDLMRLVRDELTPHFPPQALDANRQRVRYSDTNYQLLIAIAETVGGKPIHDIYAECVFNPLGLTQTWLLGRSAPAAEVATPASIWFGKTTLELPRALPCFPSVYSTVDDLLTFLRAYVDGRLFADPATVAMMQTRWNRFGLPRDAATLRAPSWPIEHALGLMRFQVPRLFAPFRPVPMVLGHTGSTGSWLFYCPSWDLLLAGTVDQATAGPIPYRFVPRLLQAIGPHVMPPHSR